MYAMSSTSDLLDCQVRNEEGVVHILKDKFNDGQFYVDAGDVLVTVNSWKEQTNEVLEREIMDYINVLKTVVDPVIFYPIGLPPHPFTVAEKALRDMQQSINVSIIPLGKSGSGKSYIIGNILRYFSSRFQHCEHQWSNDISTIVYILDLFCNAKTLICDKSTRCLKLYEIFFNNNSNNIEGVRLKVCLLDKFRVVSRIINEDNFNIFNTFLNELHSLEQLDTYFLNGNHRYVQLKIEDNCYYPVPYDNSLIEVFSILKFDQEEINGVFSLLSAIILIGDIEFGQSKKKCVVLNNDLLQKVAKLLGVASSNVHALLFAKLENVKGTKIKVSTSYAKLTYQRDCLAVFLYERLVQYVVSKINEKHNSESSHSILLLDIFGWENYNVNFYEQLVVNTSNEALQSFYKSIVFEKYQRELENEGFSLEESLTKCSHAGVVPFLFKPKGLLDLLHESVGNKRTKSDRTLLKRMNTKFKKEAFYAPNKMGNPEFFIQHFFDEVSYEATGFLAKCTNSFDQDAILNCFQASTNPALHRILQDTYRELNIALNRASVSHQSSSNKRIANEDYWSKTELFLTKPKKKEKKLFCINSNAKNLTVELSLLFERLLSTKIHFIRCINSNIRKEPLTFDEDRVLSQVKSIALFSTLQTRNGNFKMAVNFSDFLSRYKLMFFPLSLPINASRENLSIALSKYYSKDHFRVGNTKIFMSEALICELERKLDKRFHQIILVQKVIRGFHGRKQFSNMVEMKQNYDQERSKFLLEMSDSNMKFSKHLELQIFHDRGRSNKRDLGVVQTDTTTEIHEAWCKVICFQRSKQLAMFSIREDKLIIDGTVQMFTTNRIGFNSFETPEKDTQMAKVKKCIGKGIQLFQSEDGHLMAKRLCKNAIFVKGHYCEDNLIEKLGELEKMKETKVFDYNLFVESVNYKCHPTRVDMDTKDHCLASCAVHVCFIKNSNTDEDSPCWVEVVLPRALSFVQSAVFRALETRREIQKKCHFQEPPALRIDSKTESVSAKILKLIRPSRYIETVKFGRRAWARKRVQSNPFLYQGIYHADLNVLERARSPRSSDASFISVENNNISKRLCSNDSVDDEDVSNAVDEKSLQSLKRSSMPKQRTTLQDIWSQSKDSYSSNNEKASTPLWHVSENSYRSDISSEISYDGQDITFLNCEVDYENDSNETFHYEAPDVFESSPTEERQELSIPLPDYDLDDDPMFQKYFNFAHEHSVSTAASNLNTLQNNEIKSNCEGFTQQL